MTCGYHNCCSSQLPPDNTERPQLNRNNPPGWGYTFCWKLKYCRDAAWDCCSGTWEAQSRSFFLTLVAEEAIYCWPVPAALSTTSSSGSGVLAGTARCWSQAKQGLSFLCCPPGSVGSHTNLSFSPCHGLRTWASTFSPQKPGRHQHPGNRRKNKGLQFKSP